MKRWSDERDVLLQAGKRGFVPESGHVAVPPLDPWSVSQLNLPMAHQTESAVAAVTQIQFSPYVSCDAQADYVKDL